MADKAWSWGAFKKLGMYEYMWHRKFGLLETMKIKRLQLDYENK